MALDPARAQQLAKDCWRKGTEALNAQNWDFAVEMFGQAVKMVPDNLMYRQVLRGAEKKKYGDNGKGASFAGAKLMGSRNKIKKARSGEEWDAVDQEAEEGLKVNPWDVGLNAALGEACAKRELLDIAIFAYSEAVRVEPDNTELLAALGDVHMEKKNWTEASQCWSRVYKLEPLNGVARQKISDIEVLRTKDRGGYEDAESTREVKVEKAQPTAYDLARGSRTKEAVAAPGEDPISDLQRLIRKEPKEVGHYLKLAELYTDEKKLAEAEKTLRDGLEATGDESVREPLERAELAHLRARLDKAEDAARVAGTDDAKQRRDMAAKALLKRELEVFQAWSDRRPKDSGVKFELAKRLKTVRKYEDAVKLLQQAVADQRIKGAALVMLGECFVRLKRLPLARRQYDQALPLISKHDEPDLFKEAHYMAGRIAEQDGQRDAAEAHYNDILEIDYGYKDVVDRLEKLQSGESAGPDAE